MRSSILFAIFIIFACQYVKASYYEDGDDDDGEVDWTIRYYNDLKIRYEEPQKEIPRTYYMAKKKGWVVATKIEKGEGYDCHNEGYFLGIRMVDPKDPGVGLLYDMRGKLCGFQFLIADSSLSYKDRERFEKEPAFQKTKLYIYGKYYDYYQITVYVREPETICNRDYYPENKYTIRLIDGIWCQRGLTARKKHLLQVPLIMDVDEEDEQDWTKLGCYDGMGYLTGFYLEAWNETNCERGFPIVGLYDPRNVYLAGIAMLIILEKDEYPKISDWVDHLDPAEIQDITSGPECLKDYTLLGLFFYAIKDPEGMTCPYYDEEYDEYTK